MSKIKINIPEWAEDKNIYVFGGIELIAWRELNQEKFNYITTRCNQCGKCCERIDPKFHAFPVEDGVCTYLTKFSDGTSECSLKIFRPFGCCHGIPDKEEVPECVVESEEK